MALGRTFDSKIPVCHFPLKLTWSQQWKLREWGHDKSKNFTKGKDSNVEEKKIATNYFFTLLLQSKKELNKIQKLVWNFSNTKETELPGRTAQSRKEMRVSGWHLGLGCPGKEYVPCKTSTGGDALERQWGPNVLASFLRQNKPL